MYVIDRKILKETIVKARSIVEKMISTINEDVVLANLNFYTFHLIFRADLYF